MSFVYTLPVGTTILDSGTRRYKIVQVLGQGGFGITYKVMTKIMVGNVSNTIYFAIKEHFVKGCCHRGYDGVSVEASAEAEEEVKQSLQDFIIEGRRLNKICKKNRNIVDVNEVFEANNTAYFVMEYLDSGNLRDLVMQAKRGLPEAKVLWLLRPIANAVEFIHNEKLLHLDIKPENIVMRTNDDGTAVEPVLIDFGVACHFNNSGKPTSPIRSAAASEGYTPTEQYGGITKFLPQADIYALSATLFYLLTGVAPVKAFEVQEGYVESKLRPLRVSELTIKAISLGMSPRYQDRPRTISEFMNCFEKSFSLPMNFKLLGGRITYRILSVEEETDFYFKYKCHPYTRNNDTHVSKGNTTLLNNIYTVWEYRQKGNEQRLSNGMLVFQKLMSDMGSDFFKLAAEKTNLKHIGQYDITGTRLNSEFFESNGTMYFSKHNRWKARPKHFDGNKYFFKSKFENIGRISFPSYLLHLPRISKKAWFVTIIIICSVTFYYLFGWLSFSIKKEIVKPSEDKSQMIQDTSKIESVEDAMVKKEKLQTNVEKKKEVPVKLQTDKITDTKPNKESIQEEKQETKSENSNNIIYEKAIQTNDIKSLRFLADRGYAKAYSRLATLYLRNNNYSEAHKFAVRAKSSGVGKDEAEKVLETLEAFGYMDF